MSASATVVSALPPTLDIATSSESRERADFFLALGDCARLLTPLFARSAAWRWLDAGVGVTMWLLAVWLASG